MVVVRVGGKGGKIKEVLRVLQERNRRGLEDGRVVDRHEIDQHRVANGYIRRVLDLNDELETAEYILVCPDLKRARYNIERGTKFSRIGESPEQIFPVRIGIGHQVVDDDSDRVIFCPGQRIGKVQRRNVLYTRHIRRHTLGSEPPLGISCRNGNRLGAEPVGLRCKCQRVSDGSAGDVVRRKLPREIVVVGVGDDVDDRNGGGGVFGQFQIGNGENRWIVEGIGNYFIALDRRQVSLISTDLVVGGQHERFVVAGCRVGNGGEGGDALGRRDAAVRQGKAQIDVAEVVQDSHCRLREQRQATQRTVRLLDDLQPRGDDVKLDSIGVVRGDACSHSPQAGANTVGRNADFE